MLGRITVILLFLLLVWGNLVGGLKAGLACPDWPLCLGRVLPPFRIDVWMEFLHRVIAAVSAIFLFSLSWNRFTAYRGMPKIVPVAAVTLMAGQILIGGVVVLLEIPIQLTTIHFMTGLAVFLLAFYMMICDGVRTPAIFPLRGRSGMFFAMGILVFFQASLGAYVRHSRAGLACPDFPTCMGAWVPQVMDWLVVVQLLHRFLGILLAFTFLALYAATYIDAGLAASRNASFMLLVFTTAQVALGALVVLSGLSFVASAIHMALALSILLLLFHLWMREARQQNRVLQAV